jgi:hypothetical protein
MIMTARTNNYASFPTLSLSGALFAAGKAEGFYSAIFPSLALVTRPQGVKTGCARDGRSRFNLWSVLFHSTRFAKRTGWLRSFAILRSQLPEFLKWIRLSQLNQVPRGTIRGKRRVT